MQTLIYRIKKALPELELALSSALNAAKNARTPEQHDFNTVTQHLESAKAIFHATVNDTQDLQNAITNALVHINHACGLAMHNTLAARIPESGDFGSIAQSLDWVRNTLRDKKVNE